MNLSLSGPRRRFEFSGGNLCLDFTNTLEDRWTDQPKELLTTYADLVAWSVEGGALTRKAADRLLRLAAESPGQATTTLRLALHLREAIYAVFAAAVERRVVPGNALAIVNSAVQQAARRAQIAHARSRFIWEWVSLETHLDAMLWPVARAAADLLTSDQLALVRICASDTCAWLFLDNTKNHRRRWCDMRTCGNRDKARRYYQRKKA